MVSVPESFELSRRKVTFERARITAISFLFKVGLSGFSRCVHSPTAIDD